jgi:hypothetical protein
MAVTKSSRTSAATSKARCRSQSPSVKDTVLGKPLVAQPRNSGNAWQDRYDATFIQAHFPTYEKKTVQRKGKEYAAQCADQYFKLYDVKCKQLFDPKATADEPVTDVKGYEAWKKKRAGV